MPRLLMAAILLITIVGCAPSSRTEQPAVRNGILDLTLWDRDSSPVINLSGNWIFYDNYLLYPSDRSKSDSDHVYATVPGLWNRALTRKRASGTGYATYKLIIITPDNKKELAIKFGSIRSSYICWLNGQFVNNGGVVGSTKTSSIPQFSTKLVPVSLQKGTNELIIQVSNYHDNQGGFWDPLYFGDYGSLNRDLITSLSQIFILAGFLIFAVLFLFVICFFTNSNRDMIPLILFAILLAIRILLEREHFLYNLIENKVWPVLFKAEYLSGVLALTSVFFYLMNSLLKIKNLKTHLILTPMYITCMVILFSSSLVFSKTLYIIYFYMVLQSILILLTLAVRVKRKYNTIADLLFTSVVVIYVGYYTFLRIFLNESSVAFYFVLGLYIFYLVAARYITLIKSYNNSRSDNIQTTNRYIYGKRLYSSGLLDLFRKPVENLKSGDSIMLDGTLLLLIFSRETSNVFSQSEEQEWFVQLNSVYASITSHIKEQNGIPVYYRENSMLILFTGTVIEAYKSALNAFDFIQKYNRKGIQISDQSIKSRIVMYKSRFVIALAGSDDTLQPVITGDRIKKMYDSEKIGKDLEVKFIINREIFYYLVADTDSRCPLFFRLLGQATTNLNEDGEAIYEIFEHIDSETRDLRESTKDFFENGVCNYMLGNLEKAEQQFAKTINMDPNDRTAQIYLEKVKTRKKISIYEKQYWVEEI
ncbi:MAG: hypothetical protein JXR90_14135 [Spirochaetes bacterium]|nr:hypothetical protein [Spirochaetota bacterium]